MIITKKLTAAWTAFRTVGTKGGEQFHLIQAGLSGPWTLIWGESPGRQKTYPTLAQAQFSLGGMVSWYDWSDDVLEWLKAFNDGKAI